jgi:hypothetical protein
MTRTATSCASGHDGNNMKHGHIRFFLALGLVWAIAYSIHAVRWYSSRMVNIREGERELTNYRATQGVAVVTRDADGTITPVVVGEYLHDFRAGEHTLRVPDEVAACFKSAQSPPSHFGLVRGDIGIEQVLVLDEFGGKLADAGFVTYADLGAKSEDDPANKCASDAQDKLAEKEKAQGFERRFALWRTMAWQFSLGTLAIAALVALGVWVRRGFARKPAK